MTVINTNVGALTARTFSIKANESMQKSMERLSSGLRINSAADDAAGLAVANKMESQLRGMNVAIRNSQDGISLVQTAEAGMGEISNMVIRMRELAVQMNNGVYTSADRSNAQLEVTALLAEIDKIASNTAFNDVKVLDGSYSADIRAGNTNAEVINVTIDRMKTDTIGGNYVTTGVTKAAAAEGSSVYSTNSKTVLTVKEGDGITIANGDLSPELKSASPGAKAFTKLFTGGAYSLTGTDKDLFSIDASGDITSSVRFDADVKSSYSFNVVYTANNEAKTTFTDAVTLNVTAATVPSANQTTATVITTAESNDFTAQIKNTSTGDTADNSVMSRAFIAFQEANAGGTFSIVDGDDKADFAMSDAGVLTLAADKTLNANAADVTKTITVKYEKGDASYTEKLQIKVTNSTADDTVQPTGSTEEKAGAASTTLAITSSTVDDAAQELTFTKAGIKSDGSAATGAGLKLSAAAQAYIVAAGDDLTVTVSAEVADTDSANAASVDTDTGVITVAASATASADTASKQPQYTITLGGGTGTFVETLTLDITASGDAGTNAIGAATSTRTAATTTLTGAKADTGGGTFTFDLNPASDSKFASLAAFMTANDSNGDFTLTAQDGVALTKADASAADGVGTITVSGLAASTEKTIVVRYTANNNEIFDQTIKLTAAAQTESEATTTGAFSSSATVPDSDTTSTLAIKGVSNLTFEEARQGTVETSVLSSGLAAFVTANPAGTYTVTGDDKASFNIDATTGKLTTASIVDFEAKESYDINVVYTKGSDSFTETVKIAVTDSDADSGTHLADVSLTTSEGAATAVTILDKALGQISSSQAKLGAIQNRLQHNIDNLSMASMLTETARGRVVDADFARETSELSKQQILGQAATSMLAQANQSKQSVLALLQ